MSCPFSGSSTKAPSTKVPSDKVGACPWATESVSFKRWVTDAVTKEGAERAELYTFLAECFKDADTDRDGFVNTDEFDFLVEKAAALPRRFGLAPSWKDLYGDVATRQKARAELYDKVNAHKKAAIGIDDWIQYAFKHIAEKVTTMPMETLDFNNLKASGKTKFLEFLKTAVSTKSSIEYQELYQFLFKNFVIADTDQKGRVTFEQFDQLVELSADAPRSLGLAPSTEDMFSNDEARTIARKELFDGMDTDGSGTVSFDKYLTYTLDHIKEKVNSELAETPVFAAEDWKTTASAFAPWVRMAVTDKGSSERQELYTFLTDSFMDADADRDGFVNMEEFDFLCEKAAALPRRFGLAPSWQDLYGNVEGRFEARMKLFKTIDTTGRGKIGIDDWVQYAFTHIEEKVKTMHTEVVDFNDLPTTGKDKFISFLQKATSDRKSREYTELYGFLFACFLKADKEAKGAVTVAQFDYLVEISADAPRVVGLAPKSSDMFKTDAERIESREQLFKSMDEDGGGTITFDEYLEYTMKHIAGKVGSASEGACPMGFS